MNLISRSALLSDDVTESSFYVRIGIREFRWTLNFGESAAQWADGNPQLSPRDWRFWCRWRAQRLANRWRNPTCLARCAMAGAALLTLSNAWAATDTSPIRLIFGDWSTAREPGEVVISATSYGYISGEEAFPAISADGTKVALLYGSHEIYDGWALDIIDVKLQTSIERFYINWSREDFSPLRETEVIRVHMEKANAYLENERFSTLEPLFDFRFIYSSETQLQYVGHEFPELWPIELDPWRIVYQVRAHRLEIFDQRSDEAVFSVSLPLLSYGIRAGVLCKIRPKPLRGWYDAGADLLIVGVIWGASHLACDRPPRWLVARLRPTS